jgi:hypothetical protein
MRLVYTSTQQPVQIGDIVTIDDEEVVVNDIRRPHKPASTGRVYVRYAGARYDAEFFPSVIGAEWIEREDQE